MFWVDHSTFADEGIISEAWPAAVGMHAAHDLDRAISPTNRLTGPEMEELAQLIFASSRDDAAAYVATRLAAGDPKRALSPRAPPNPLSRAPRA